MKKIIIIIFIFGFCFLSAQTLITYGVVKERQKKEAEATKWKNNYSLFMGEIILI